MTSDIEYYRDVKIEKAGNILIPTRGLGTELSSSLTVDFTSSFQFTFNSHSDLSAANSPLAHGRYNHNLKVIETLVVRQLRERKSVIAVKHIKHGSL